MKNAGGWGAIVVVAMIGCSSGGGSGDAGSSGDAAGGSAIVGTWLAQITTGADHQTETLTFGADGSLVAAHSQIDAATASDHAGCTEVVTESGRYADSADHASVTVTPVMATQTYSGCASSADDGTAGFSGTPIFFVGGMTTDAYTVSGNTLTIQVGGSPTAFTRQ